MEKRFCELKASSARLQKLAARYEASLESSERTRDNTEKLAKQCGKLVEMVAVMEHMTRALTGFVKEAWQGVAVERGRIDNLSGFVLPRLGNTLATVDEVQKQMAEHREYCGAVLRELRGAAIARLRHSRDVSVGGVQNVAEGDGSDMGTVEPDEMTAELRTLQEEVRMLQEAVGNIGVEVQWVAQGGESKAQNLQGEMEGVWTRSGGFRSLQRS